MQELVLLSREEFSLRLSKVQRKMREASVDAILVADNANKYYLSGRVFAGFAYIPSEGAPLWLVRRPVGLGGEGVFYFRRPDELPSLIADAGAPRCSVLGLEYDIAPYSHVVKLQGIFSAALPEVRYTSLNPLMREARAVKTPEEIRLMKLSGFRHEQVYRRIPGLFRVGMTDLELQVEIERLSRLEGCLGVFRISGQSMELFMGNILSGKNADVPTPYDFAMGGAGLDPSLPVGASGEEIKEHTTVMVDINGDYTGYMTDMTRVFTLGTVPQLAVDAHRCSIDICRMFEREALPGVEARTLYAMIEDMVRERHLERWFMGHRQHAGFVGHGLGIEINELPVIAPRSASVLEENNMVALEPKFVIPDVGAVGIENTYHITSSGAVSVTNAPEELTPLL